MHAYGCVCVFMYTHIRSSLNMSNSNVCGKA